MKNSKLALRSGLIFLVLLCVWFLGAWPARGGRLAQEIDFTAIDETVQREMASASIPGLAYAVVAGGQVVHRNAFGASGPGGQPVTPQTPFGTGSTAKMWTALAVQQLVQAGKLDLEAPVQRYLPWFRAADEAASARITVRHLVQHQSGFSTAAGNDMLLVRGDPTAEELVRRLANVPLAFEPGSRREYCNLNFITLSVVIEAAAGTAFPDYVQEHIFDPLEMRDSYLSAEEARQNGAAQGHRILFGFPVAMQEKMNESFAAEGVGTFSTVEDMAHFLAALLNGGQYGSVTVLQPAKNAGGEALLFDEYWFPIETPAGEDNIFGHGGATISYVSEVAFSPHQRLGVVFLSNANTFASWPAAKSAQSIAFDVLYQLLELPAPAPAPAIRSVHLGFNAVLLAVGLGVGAQALRLRGWQARVRRSSRAVAIMVLILADWLLPLAMLAFLPTLITAVGGAPQTNPVAGWALLFLIMPDIAGVLFAAALALLIIGLVKVVLLKGSGRWAI